MLSAWRARVRPPHPLRLAIGKRSDNGGGYLGQPQRGIVERTFGGLNRSRRLRQDSETLPVPNEARLYVALIRLMMARLARGTL